MRLTGLAILAVALVACRFGGDAKLGELEADLAPVLENSNARGRLLSDPENTGDALWDDYCTAVAARFAFRDEDDKLLDAAVIPDEILAAWEPEFGGDERYWELRYCLAACSDFGQSADGRYLNPTDFLREARERGVAGANTLLLLYLARTAEYDERIDRRVTPPLDPNFAFGDLGPPDHLPLHTEPDPQRLRETLELHAQRDAEALELLDAAVELGDGEAWPYYFRAMYWLNLGEYERGLADLEAGNAAPYVAYPLPFPLDQAHRALAEADPPGGPATCGAILIMGEGLPRREYTPLLSLLLDSLTIAGLSGDPSLLNAWQRFICRSPGEGTGDTLPFYVSLYMVQQFTDYWEQDYAGCLEPEQLAALRHVRGAVNSARRPVRRLYRDYSSLDFSERLVEVTGDRGYYLAGYLWAELGSHIGREMLKPLLDGVAGLTYPGLEMPPGIEQYPLLTIEEAQRHRDRADRDEE